ncbi:uncharacterized [Tachysurus ichikawai]
MPKFNAILFDTLINWQNLCMWWHCSWKTAEGEKPGPRLKPPQQQPGPLGGLWDPGCVRATDVLPALPGVTLDRPVAACPLDTAGSLFNLPREGRARDQAREGGGYRNTLSLMC